MSRTYQAEGIILKASAMGEADRLLSVLSPSEGLIKLIAPNARKTKSKMGGRTALFVVNQMMCLKGRSLDKLLQADVKYSYPGLSKHLAKLTTAQYWAELILCQSIDGSADRKLYELFIQLLAQLEDCEPQQVYIALVQGMSLLLHHAGINPQLNYCCRSQEKIEPTLIENRPGVLFSYEDGGVILAEASSATPKREKSLLVETKTDYTGYVQSRSPSSNQGYRWSPQRIHRLTLAQWLILNVITPESLSIPQPTNVYEEFGTHHWSSVEKILRGYAQHHFDRSIRSASLVNTVFQL